ncbi:MAG: PAS domain S-box protein [Planctomycetes bacterium]|jgi:PAS domain S-box-containing protein|nr:PAS domain S-box protein [Planctomycetota bacterium]
MDTPGPFRLLIVEDDLIDRRLLERLLAQSPLGRCTIENTDRLADALERVRDRAFDVILLDPGLPDSQGMESVARMQAQAPQTPIIVLSGLDDAEVATQAVHLGVQDYLIKGQVDGSLLLRAVRYAVERKKAERQLQAAEQRYRTIFENSAVAIMMVDDQERLVSWNQQTERLLGMTADQLRGRSIQSCYPDDQWQRIRELSVRHRGREHHLETKMIRGDARVIDVDMSLSVVHDSEGRATGSIAVVQDVTERRQAEEALRASETQLQTIVENLTEGLVVSDLEGRLQQWNHAALEIHGFANPEDGRCQLHELANTFELSTLEGVVLPVEQWPLPRILKGEELRDWEVRVRRVDRDWRRVFSYGGTLVRDPQGQPLLALVTVNDITGRKRAEETLLVKDRAVNSATSGIAFTDLDGRVTFANPSCLKMWGFEQESEVLHRFVTSLVVSPQDAVAALQAAVATGAWSGEMAARRKDGSEFVVQVSASLVKDKQGRPLCLMASLVDVTETRRLHAILDGKQKNLAAIFDAAPLGMLLANEDLQVVRANETVRQMSGRGYAQIINGDVCQALACLRGADVADSVRAREACAGCQFRTIIGKALESGQATRGVEIQPVWGEGEEAPRVWLSVSAEPVFVDGAQHVVVVLHDVTDRKRAEEELKETLEMKAQFISTVSHELRTPMTAIREAVIIVQDEIAGKLNKDQKHFLDIAKRNIDRLARLIDDVLDFQRLNAGKMKFHLQAVNLAVMIEEACTTMQPHAAKSKVDLAVELEAHLPAVVCDSDRMMQVLTNLISNALKFTPEGGRVLVSAGGREEQVAIKIRDTGYGIPKEDLPKLFTRFFRVHRPGKEIKGTGLGLAIVSKIVTGHGGRIEVESELDKGTTFTVILPVTQPCSLAEAAESSDRGLEHLLTGA